MVQKVFALTADFGDGSNGIRWFRDKELVQRILDSEDETYQANEGSPAEELTFPDDLDLKACGFHFYGDSLPYSTADLIEKIQS